MERRGALFPLPLLPVRRRLFRGFRLRPLIERSDERDIAEREQGDEHDHDDDPIKAAHEIGHLGTEPEGAGGRIPIEEEIRIVVAAAEIPVERIADSRKAKIIDGRDERKGELLIGDLLRAAEKEVDDRRERPRRRALRHWLPT